jgi:hypothetical protein
MNFALAFEPSLPSGDYDGAPLSADLFNPRVEDYDREKYVDVVISIGRRKFRYQPTDIWTVLNDLYEAFRSTTERSDHDLHISGYPILRLSFRGDNVKAESITEDVFGKRFVSDLLDVREVEKSLKIAIGSVLRFIEKGAEASD